MFKPSTLIAILLALGLAAWLYSGDMVIGGQGDTEPPIAETSQSDNEATVAVRVAESVARDRFSEVVLRGQTEAERMVEVRAETEGLIEEIAVERGQAVARGDLLCRIETGAREAQLLQWQAELERAEADYQAALELSESGFAADTRVRSLRAARDAAQASVSQSSLELRRTSLRAPFDGVIESLPSDPGDQLRIGDVCAMVVDADPMLVVAQASELEVSNLVEGYEAEVALVTGETRPAVVSFIASTADDDTRTFRIELTVDNEDQAIKSGLTSRISVKLPPTQAHYVKPSALTLADDGTVGVRVAVDDSARFLPVTILGGDRDGIWLGGLPDQIDLIVVGQEYVTDGTALDITRVELGAGS